MICIEKSFAGMKKGFLNNAGSSSTSKSNELIEISRGKSESKKDFRVLDEVQQVMKEEEQSKSSSSTVSSFQINRTICLIDNWLTTDLLKQIEDDESLSRYFSNPYFMEAITLFQHKPQEALAKYGHNTEVMTFFNRMAKILGTLT